MTKLSLKAKPTFTAKVAVPVAGGESVDITFTFKHRTKTQLDEFINSRQGVDDVVSFMDMVSAWDLEGEEFNADNVRLLLENYIGVAVSTYRIYIEELLKAKLGN